MPRRSALISVVLLNSRPALRAGQTRTLLLPVALMPEVIIPGPAGRLEARYRPAQVARAPVALVMHPSPLLDFTMKSPIVDGLYEKLSEHDFSVLRFNFRGVGRSEGQKGAGDGEVSDAAAVLDWVQMQSPEASAIWVAGFSFGAWVAMQLLMRRPEVDRFIVLAPLANKFDFSFLQPCPASGLVVQGDKDGFSNPVSVGNWVRELNMQTDVQAKDIEIVYKIIPGADHFFTNHTDKMIRAVERYVRSVHAPAEPKKKKPPARSSRRKKTSSRSRAS